MSDLGTTKKNQSDFLEKLLDGAEVEWLPLGDLVATIRTGKLNANAMVEGGKYPFFTCDANPFNIDTYAFDTEAIIISGNGSQVGHINYYKGKFNAYQRTYILADCTDNIIMRYLLTYLKAYLRPYIIQHSKKGSVPYITMPMLQNFQIPIPCQDNPEKSLAIQAEIVRILDTFTELKARKKQYNYYRDQLLTFDEGEVEWKTLGEVGEWYGGGTPSKSRPEFWENGTIPWISPKDMGRPIIDSSQDYISEAAIKESSTKMVPPNSIAIVVRSSILDKFLPSALIPVPVTLNQDMKAVIPNEEISGRYMSHVIRSCGYDILRAAKKTGGSVASIDSKKLFAFRIPVPSSVEQARIVGILDKFDTITHSISEGLPREIELRQKQYEYYRDLLLSFPKPTTDGHR